MFLVILIYSQQAHANPVTRYDAASNTTRVLSEGPLYWESYAFGEGGKTFKTKCQSCHNGNDKSAPFLWSESKNQDAWNRVFSTRYPKCAKDGSWKGISDEQLRMVNDYLWRFADNVVENVCRG
jgi:mono/diheme cytochrome c family protein